jgi:hypothetical protein
MPDGVRRKALPKTERRQRPVEVGRDYAAEVQDQTVVIYATQAYVVALNSRILLPRSRAWAVPDPLIVA